MRRATMGCKAAALTLALLVPSLPPAGAAADPLDPNNCLYPLGPAAENGRFAVFSTGEDPERAIIDGSFSGSTKTYLTVVPVWDTLYAVYDGRFRLGDGGPGQQGGSKHNIHVKAWGLKGWNSTVEYPSNQDVKNATPEGNNVNPHAAAFKDQLWVAFSRESTFNLATIGTPIVMRGRAADGTWGPFLNVTEPLPESQNQIPNLIPVGDRLLIVWVHYDLVSHIGDTVIQGRFFDGASFGPVFNISRSEDGFADNYFTLATDGQRAAVAWVSQDLSRTAGSQAPKFALFDGALWRPEVELWSQNGALSYAASAGFFGGKLYLAFDTTDERLSVQGDYDLFLRVADLETLALSEVVPLSDAQGLGDDYQADFAAFNGRLHLVWVSGDDQVAAGPDLDLVYRTFDGTAWSPPRDLTADQRYENDEQIAEFIVHEGALQLYWITYVKPPGSTTKDQRVATLLVERGPRWWDGLEASVDYGAPPADGANVTARITVRSASGAPVDSPWFSARLANGSWQRLEGASGNYSLNFTYNASLVEPFKVLACGKPISVKEAAGAPPSQAPGGTASPALVAAGALGVAAAGGLVFAFARTRRREEG